METLITPDILLSVAERELSVAKRERVFELRHFSAFHSLWRTAEQAVKRSELPESDYSLSFVYNDIRLVTANNEWSIILRYLRGRSTPSQNSLLTL